MSYARFGAGGSSVYVFISDRGLECCACPLLDWGDPTPVFQTTEGMIGHLDAHRAEGHTVTEDTYESLRADRAENDNYMKTGIWETP